MVDVCSQVGSIHLFRDLPEAQRRSLADIAVDRRLPKGKVIFSDGQEANGFYTTTEGRVKIYKLSPEGKEQILHIFGPGEMFAEVAVFEGRHFPAYAETLEESRVLFFPRDAFIGLARKDPTLLLRMLAELSRKLRQFTNLIESLSLKEVPGRLAAYLLVLHDAQGSDMVALDLTKTQLASLLGTIPETLSRILARMTREGFIESPDTRTVRILDRESLEALATGESRLA